MKNKLRIKKLQLEDIFPLIVTLLLVFIIFAIAFFAFRGNQTPIQPPVELNPTTAPNQNQAQQYTKIYTPVYNKQAQERLMQKIENRAQLSSTDRAIKNKILSALPSDKRSGVLHETATIRIDYTSGPDLFQVEILTPNLNTAKQEGNNWFLSQGLSQQAICDLPVDFYLSWQVVEQLQDKLVSFSPSAPGCE